MAEIERIEFGMHSYYKFIKNESQELVDFYEEASKKLSPTGLGITHHSSTYSRPRYETLPVESWEGGVPDTIVRSIFMVPGTMSFYGIVLDSGNEFKYIVNLYDGENDKLVSECDSLNDLFLRLMMALSL